MPSTSPGAAPAGGAPAGGGGAAGAAVEPVKGPIDLATATAGLAGTGPLVAELETDKGKLTCKLFDDKAPKAVANFVGLARGLQPFKDPATAKWVKRPAYDGSRFHRIMKGFMSQGGDPTGTGTGDPGYVFPDENPTGKHDRPGLLCMANKGPNTNGMQFFITDGAPAWLDYNPPQNPTTYTIFGECGPLEVVHALGSVPVSGETPIVKPAISKVTIRRE
ncbi:MAG: peptidylprolyl isomerase [Deltaproteobacteria bacterium]|nr:peptidylprolyl isomerase [Deltaproteobacteria bacterium]